MRRLGKEEHAKNIQLFQRYNEEEREIVNVLIMRERERNYVDTLAKKLTILSHYKRKKLKDSQLKFAQAFCQQKNVIAKYINMGEKKRVVRNERIERREQVATIRDAY